MNLTGNPITNPGVLYPLQQGGTTITGVTIPSAVVFPDTALDTAVRSALRIAVGDTILPHVLAALTRLTAARKGITDLSGLEHATGLERLDLGQNENITDISALANLIRLENLDLADNQITDISALSGLTRLEVLDLRTNDVTDTALLSEMTHLKNLYVRGNDNLSNLKQLVRLKDAGVRVDITLPKPVTFRDANLAAALRRVLGFQDDDNIFPEDMEGLTGFEAPGMSIINLTGLETATALTTLNLSGNEIVSLSPLSKLVVLETLNLSENEIRSISSLSGLAGLTDLNLSDNEISSLSSLSKLVALESLNLSDNEISSVSSLSGLSALTDLDLSNNIKIKDVLPLQGLSSLTTLNLSGNDDITNEKAEVLYKLDQGGTNITLPAGVTLPAQADIVVFNNAGLEAAVRSALRISKGYPVLNAKITELTRLTATRKEVDDLTGLEQATNLETLDLGDNAIDDLGRLRNLSSLTSLDLADNAITDFDPLTGLSDLESLDLDSNKIVNLPSSLTGLSGLKTLDLADNQIENVSSLTGLSVLETLDLRDNNVMDVRPLSTMTHLKKLYLRGNENLSNLKYLVKLKEVSKTSIDITLPRPVTFRDDNLEAALRTALNALPNLTLEADDNIFPEDMELLTTFTASNESIVNLTGLEKAIALTSLTLSNNQIVSLSPLSKLMLLTTLNLSGNSISSISSLSKLTSLTDLNLSDNEKISSVSSLSGLTSLTDLDLSNNRVSSVTSLSKLTSLTDLNLSTNRIRDVLPLQGLSNLRTLNLEGNTDLTEQKASVLYKLVQDNPSITITLPAGITLPTNVVAFENAELEAAVRSALRISKGYPVLNAKITELTRLTTTRKEVDDLTGLEQATGLTTLDLGDNAIVNLGPLQNLTSLTSLDLADNAIVDLSPLRNLTNLTSLDLDDNEIEDVSALSGLTSLQTLDLRDNDVMDVTELKDLVNLKRIYLRGNENLTNLEWLGALENLRVDIDLPDVVRLPDTNLDPVVREALRTAGQTVSATLPMSEELLENLTTLTASNESITDLMGCEYMTGLTSLDLQNNQITDVSPLSKLYALETLMLDGNPILDTSVLRELERRGTTIDITIYRYPFWDVNQDSDVDETDVFLVTATITGESPDVNGDGNVDAEDETAADANKDGTVDTDDLLLVFEKFDRPVNLAAPFLSVGSAGLDWRLLEGIDADRLRLQLDILRAQNDGSLNYQQTIAFLQAILAAIQPNQTLLLANYPNPFNPETWIPYQLARGSNVWITIYDTRGAVVRRLALGYRAEGYYRARGRAAHWEGRNAVGERVASGIYFYQLETDDTSLLRKMVILK